jgi:hypothetical protein
MRRSCWPILFVGALLLLLSGFPSMAAAETAAGTVISNTSAATYQDSNSNTYGANSNTVSITVQNAPSLTVTASSNKTVAPGQTVTDAFTIQNTGNASGDVQITSGGVTGGTDSGSVGTVTYSYSGTSYASLATLNTALASLQVASGSSIVISVVYTVSASAGVGDVLSNLTATITYAAITGAAAATSSGASASTAETDTVGLDALLDVALASSNTSGTITYVASAVNRTTVWGAKDLLAVKALLGLSTGTGGIFISVKIPQYPAGTPLTITGTIYSTASTTGASGWTAGSTPVANAAYIGVFVSGGSCTINGSTMSGVEICPIASSGSSAGVVPNPALTLTFSVTQSSATGSANAGSTQTIANSLIGSNGSTEYVIGPGISTNSLADGSGDTASITATGVGINNVTTVNAPSGDAQLDAIDLDVRPGQRTLRESDRHRIVRRFGQRQQPRFHRGFVRREQRDVHDDQHDGHVHADDDDDDDLERRQHRCRKHAKKYRESRRLIQHRRDRSQRLDGLSRERQFRLSGRFVWRLIRRLDVIGAQRRGRIGQHAQLLGRLYRAKRRHLSLARRRNDRRYIRRQQQRLQHDRESPVRGLHRDHDDRHHHPELPGGNIAAGRLGLPGRDHQLRDRLSQYRQSRRCVIGAGGFLRPGDE